MEDHLSHASVKLIIMHLYCFLAMLISKVCQAVNKKSFIHNILVMITVPTYQFGIFKAYYEIALQENIAQELGCTSMPWA